MNIWLGTLASAVLFPLAAALFWPRATRYGAIWGSAGGFAAYFGTGMAVLMFKAALPRHPLYCGLRVSLVLTVVVSLLTRPASEAALARRFEVGRG